MPAVQIRLNPYGWGITLGLLVLIVFFWTSGFSFLFSWSSTTNSKVSLRSLLSASIDLSQKAGRRVHDVYTRAKSVPGSSKDIEPTDKQSKHLTTRADFESHRIITFGLTKAFPNIKLVSEERDSTIFDKRQIDMPALDLKDLEILPPDANKITVNAKDVTIWIDPLDATLEYTETLNEYVSVMVCVAVRGRPTLGVIYQPFANELWWGWRGVGTSANIRSPAVSQPAADSKPAVIVSRSHAGAVQKVLDEALGEGGFTMQSAGGSGFKTIRLLQRRASLYPHVTASRKWDLCAPHAVLSAAGGVLRSLQDVAETGVDRLSTAFGPPAGEDDMAVNGGFVAGLNVELVERLAPRLRKAKDSLSHDKAAQ